MEIPSKFRICLRGRLLCRRGSAAFGVLAIAAIILELGAAAIFVTNNSMLRSKREEQQVELLQLAEAGIQVQTGLIWKDFCCPPQSFVEISTNTYPIAPDKELDPGRRYHIVSATSVPVTSDSFSWDVVIVCRAWNDTDGDMQYESGEPHRTIRCVMRFSLNRSGVFDYCYFVNNYGWMNGFSPSNLVVNGDMRANGNFDFSGGTPTINGSVYAAPNNKLIPPAAGVVNITPSQWSNSYYATNATTRARQAYDPAIHGTKTSTNYAQWRDIIYDHDGSKVNDVISGAVVGDKNGIKTYGGTVLDPNKTSELRMPDLSDLNIYTTLSNSYIDQKQTYTDGTANAQYNQGAYVDVWNSTTNSYKRLSTNGVVSGNASLIGTSTHPIKIHGPVTVTQDAVIAGYVSGQGTVYTGRNVHVVGSITYATPPNFKGTDPQAIDNNNEKATLLALAARGSIIMGDTSQFSSSTLQYMTPPFTKPRYDENRNYVSAFDATSVDSYGSKKYKSLLGDSYIHSVSQTISQIDAVLYTNFLGGGNVGGSSGGVTFNGSIISKDEAMILLSLPFKINYDNRIKVRKSTDKPLIDISLPKGPTVSRLTWQEVTSTQ